MSSSKVIFSNFVDKKELVVEAEKYLDVITVEARIAGKVCFSKQDKIPFFESRLRHYNSGVGITERDLFDNLFPKCFSSISRAIGITNSYTHFFNIQNHDSKFEAECFSHIRNFVFVDWFEVASKSSKNQLLYTTQPEDYQVDNDYFENYYKCGIAGKIVFQNNFLSDSFYWFDSLALDCNSKEPVISKIISNVNKQLSRKFH